MSNKDKTFYIAGQPSTTDDSLPTPIHNPNTTESPVYTVRPTTADTTTTRPTSAGSLPPNDPFATPVSSRPPSVRYLQPPSSPNASRVAFPDSVLTGPRGNRLTLIGNQPSAFSSARSSSRISSIHNVTASHSPSPSQAAVNENAAPKPKAPRMRSHMLSDSNPIAKPWKNKKNRRAIFAYWIVYIIISLGIALGAFQCYWTYTHVPLDKQPLCIVLDENFDNEDTVFGPGGTFFREVNMNGFG